MKAYLQATADGFVRKLVVAREPPPGKWEEVSDNTQINQLLSQREKFLFRRGKMEPKPTVVLVPSKKRFRADGRDFTSIRFDGVPAGTASLHVVVGATVHDVPAGDTLELTTTVIGPIRVELQEPLMQSRPLMVVATP